RVGTRPGPPSFPTRRSSDLRAPLVAELGPPGEVDLDVVALDDREVGVVLRRGVAVPERDGEAQEIAPPADRALDVVDSEDGRVRSEEHTSELQSRENLVCRL